MDGIITIDSQGLIQSFNHSAERLFGWTAEEVVGRNVKMLMPEPDQSQHDDYLRNYLNSGVPKIIGTGREVVGLRKDGSLMPMRLGVGRVDLPDELLFVGFITDISERHALETSLRETAAEAKRAAAAKSTFLANMSHEIRTPMNSIIGFTELLLQDDLSAAQRSHLNTIRESSRSLLGLINDILDTTRMEKNGLELETIDFSLKGLAAQIESTLRLSAQAGGLELTTRYPDDMPEYFRGDPLRLLQILTNLVGNAIKFTERGRVEVAFGYQAPTVCISVSDTGIGMTPQQTEAIFAPFTQADASISRRFGGTGLGTTIARQLVELMDVHMPGVDGLQATRLIRQHERDRQLAPTPIIALTASVMSEDRHAARQAGMDGFAVKPLEIPELFSEIARVLHYSPPLSSRDAVVASQVAAKSAVDWRHGTALWGNEARLSAALRQFLNGWRDRYPLPTGAEADPDWAAARFSLHGLCGAAGNLALPGYNSTGPWRTPLL